MSEEEGARERKLSGGGAGPGGVRQAAEAGSPPSVLLGGGRRPWPCFPWGAESRKANRLYPSQNNGTREKKLCVLNEKEKECFFFLLFKFN